MWAVSGSVDSALCAPLRMTEFREWVDPTSGDDVARYGAPAPVVGSPCLSTMERAFSPLPAARMRTWGVAPGWYGYAPLALKQWKPTHGQVRAMGGAPNFCGAPISINDADG